MLRIAIKFMLYDRPKSIGIIVGIVISIFLIGQQLATLQFITNAMGGLINNANSHAGEIWVIDNTTKNVNVLSNLDARLVREIRSIKGVQNTFPILVGKASIRLPNRKLVPVTLVGSNGLVFAGGPDTSRIFKGTLKSLIQPNAVTTEYFDTKAWDVHLGIGSPIEINGKNAVVKVITKNVKAFGGHFMYTSAANVRYYCNFPENMVSIITVALKPGADVHTVAERINQTFYGVKAWPVDELRETTVTHLLSATNMGLSFGTLVVFAIITGFFIIGLTMYSAILNRLKDYGTYKAIGATNGYVRKLILIQALLFALIGFLIAMGLLLLFKQGVANAGLFIHFPLWLVAFLLFVTLFISVGGALFAIQRINKVEPASVFR